MPQLLSTAWLYDLTIAQTLDRTIDRYGDNDAVIVPQLGLSWNYRQFGEQVDRASRGLLALGIRRGEHVAIWATNVPEWVVLQFATARIGAVLTTINPAYRAHELKYVLKQSDAVALVLTDRFKTSDYFAMLADVCPDIHSPTVPVGSNAAGLKSSEFPKLRQVIAIRGDKPAAAISWKDLLAKGDSISSESIRATTTQLHSTDPINIQYTSGTTGFPKAA